MIKMRGTLSIWVLFTLLAGTLCSCSGGDSGETITQVDVSTMPPEVQIFRYIDSGDNAKLDALLESNPALVNSVEQTYYNTPLHAAAMSGDQGAVDIILGHGADPLVENQNGEIPAESALQEGHVKLSKYLRELAG